MPRVVPSQVVAFIDGILSGTQEPFHLHMIDLGELSGLSELLNQIPDELLTMDTASFQTLICCQAKIREALSNFTADRAAGRHASAFLFKGQNPMRLIRDALSKCPDESPAPDTSELNFIPDPALRANLRSDIGIVTRALSNGEWKVATILAGAAIEALLLWDLQTHCTADTRKAVTALVASKTFSKHPSSNPENWSLHHYIEVAAHLKRISKETAIQARLAKHFRNLIHPGRALRLRETCDRGTAHSCFAALDHVARDLTP